MNNNKFYTYIYLDPRKPGIYQYGDYTFNFEPFYVGKGNGDRYKRHLECLLNENFYPSYFYKKIRKIKKEEFEIIKNVHVLKVEENLSDRAALDLEIWLIWAIGRYSLGIGPLTNLVEGGEGPSGRIKSIEERQKISVGNKGKIRSDEFKAKISKAFKGENHPMYGKHPSAETREKSSKSHMGISGYWKGKKLSAEACSNISKSKSEKNNPMYGKHHSAETKEKMSVAAKKLVRSEKHKENLSKAKKGKSAYWNIGREKSEETRQKISKSNKRKVPWNKGKSGVYTDAAIKRMSESHKGKIPWNKKDIPKISNE